MSARTCWSRSASRTSLDRKRTQTPTSPPQRKPLVSAMRRSSGKSRRSISAGCKKRTRRPPKTRRNSTRTPVTKPAVIRDQVYSLLIRTSVSLARSAHSLRVSFQFVGLPSSGAKNFVADFVDFWVVASWIVVDRVDARDCRQQFSVLGVQALDLSFKPLALLRSEERRV